MRSKYSRRASPAPPQGGRRTSQALVALVLLVAAAVMVLAAAWVVTNTGPGTHASVASSPPGTAEAALSPVPSAAASAAQSAAASAAPSPAAPVLEAEMPHAVNGTTLTVESATDATALGSAPSNRALNAAVTSLGKAPADLEIADAYDASGSLALSVLGFRVAGVNPARLLPMVLDAWLSTTSPGVTASSVSLLGTSATKVSYGDSGPSEYAFVHGDSVFVVATTDQALAASVVAAMATPSPSPSAS